MAPFEYSAPTPRFAATISEMLQHQGDIRAKQAESIGQIQSQSIQQQGNAWAGAAQNIGQSVAQIPQLLQQQQAHALEAKKIQAQIDDTKQQVIQRAVAAKKAQALDAQQQALDGIMKTSMVPDAETGVVKFDRPKFEEQLTSQGMGHLYPQISETLDKLDASATVRAKAGREMVAHVLQGIEQGGYTHGAALTGLAALTANGVATGAHLGPVLSLLADDSSPDAIKALVDRVGQTIPEYQTLKQSGAKAAADLAHVQAQTEAETALAGQRNRPPPAPKRTDAEMELDAYAKSLNKPNAEALTYQDRQAFEKNKEQIRADTTFQQHMRERQYDNAHPAPEKAKNQDALEQEYRTVLARGLSSRSGGVGLEDAKVQMSNHLSALIDQNYDPKTGTYNIPRVQQTELALGLARMMSPNGTVGVQLEKELNQRTAVGDLNGALTYILGTPFNGSTQDVVKMFKDSIDRQGKVAETNREGEMRYLRNLAPTDLEETRRQKLESVGLNPLRQSRVAVDANGNKRLFVSTDGGQTWK